MDSFNTWRILQLGDIEARFRNFPKRESCTPGLSGSTPALSEFIHINKTKHGIAFHNAFRAVLTKMVQTVTTLCDLSVDGAKVGGDQIVAESEWKDLGGAFRNPVKDESEI